MPIDPSNSEKYREQPKSPKRFGDDLPQEIKDRMGPDFEIMVQQIEADVAEWKAGLRKSK